MMRDLLIERLNELKQLQKEREAYDNICTNQIVGSYNLQESLSIQQKPTIEAINKISLTNPVKISDSPIQDVKIKKENLIETKTETEEIDPLEVEVVISQKIFNFLSDKKIIPLKIILPELNMNNITKSIKPDVSLIEINNKNFLEIKLKKNKIYFYEKDKNYYFTIFDEDEDIENHSFNKLIIDLIYGNVDLEKENYTFAEKKYMHTYLIIIGANTRNSNYCKKIKEIAGVIKMKEKKYKSAENIAKLKPEAIKNPFAKAALTQLPLSLGKGFLDNNPIELFERLTLLISAVKAGHNNLEDEIKKTAKKLMINDLISKEKYNEYKEKYFLHGSNGTY